MRHVPLGLLIFIAIASLAVAAGDAKRNVLFIVVDDLNTDLGSYGNRQVVSPHIDRLAAQGVKFTRAYAQYPLCNPSRVSFLSGRRPENTGVYVLNIAPRTAMPDVVTLPQLFRQNGYFTAGVGKIFHSRGMNDPEAWDHFEDGAGEDEQEKAAISARYGGGDGRPRAHVLDGDGSLTRDGMNTATIKRLLGERAADQRPFFLALGFHKPHLPWTAPKKFFDLYDVRKLQPPAEPRMENVPAIALQTELSGFPQPDSVGEAIRGYYACVTFIDDLLGSLVAELERLKLADSTTVVFFSDHGFHLGDHGGLWAKLSAFDRATRVPLVMSGAGVPRGQVVEAPVELLDIFPTLAQLAGLPLPPKLDGMSLVPALRGERLERSAASMVYHYDVAAKRDVLGRTIIARDARYTEWDQGKAGSELYAHATDPGEYRNRVGDSALQPQLTRAKQALAELPTPKPGPANRPRAIDPTAKKKK